MIKTTIEALAKQEGFETYEEWLTRAQVDCDRVYIVNSIEDIVKVCKEHVGNCNITEAISDCLGTVYDPFFEKGYVEIERETYARFFEDVTDLPEEYSYSEYTAQILHWLDVEWSEVEVGVFVLWGEEYTLTDTF